MILKNVQYPPVAFDPSTSGFSIQHSTSWANRTLDTSLRLFRSSCSSILLILSPRSHLVSLKTLSATICQNISVNKVLDWKPSDNECNWNFKYRMWRDYVPYPHMMAINSSIPIKSNGKPPTKESHMVKKYSPDWKTKKLFSDNNLDEYSCLFGKVSYGTNNKVKHL